MFWKTDICTAPRGNTKCYPRWNQWPSLSPTLGPDTSEEGVRSPAFKEWLILVFSSLPVQPAVGKPRKTNTLFSLWRCSRAERSNVNFSSPCLTIQISSDHLFKWNLGVFSIWKSLSLVSPAPVTGLKCWCSAHQIKHQQGPELQTQTWMMHAMFSSGVSPVIRSPISRVVQETTTL